VLTYDALGRVLTKTAREGLANQETTTYTYDFFRAANATTTAFGYSPQRGWLLTQLTSNTTATPLQDATYTRDALGRITVVTSSLAGEGWIYTYDDLDRLLSADNNAADNSLDQTFSYDVVGNMLTNSKVGTYGYGAQGSGSARPHATTGISGGPLGSQSFFYDGNGSMTCQGGSGPTCPGGDNRRDYDGENRLVTAVDGLNTTSIVYGPDGARLKKTVAVTGSSSTKTLYFGDDVELTAGKYLKYLPGDAKKDGSGAGGALYWQHRDHLQSVRVVTKADGTKDDGATYRPYGEQMGFAGSTPQTKGFIGQRLDGESGLMFLHARYYDPQLGRFIQADPSNPVGAGVGINRYAYAANNPVLHLDPSGLNYGAVYDGGPIDWGSSLPNSPGSIMAAIADNVGIDPYRGMISEGTKIQATGRGGFVVTLDIGRQTLSLREAFN
jgi:RHS repeat-associated protein